MDETLTDPNNADSDDDGLTDAREVDETLTDPNNADTDADGLNDLDEVDEHGTDPLNEDTDGGGAPDGQEIEDGTDPLDDADDLLGEEDDVLDGTYKGGNGLSCATGEAAPQAAGGILVALLALVGLRRRR